MLFYWHLAVEEPGESGPVPERGGYKTRHYQQLVILSWV